MSSLGLPFTSADRIPSQAKVNLKMNIIATGDEILALSLVDPRDIGQLAVCKANSTGNALLAHNIYEWQGSGTGWVIKSISTHTHADNNTGGSMQTMMQTALNNLYHARFISPTHEQFFKLTTGATYTNQISGTSGWCEIATGATSNNYGNLIVMGRLPTLTQKISFQTRLKLSTVTANYNARVGINAEYAHVVTNNANKFGFEACSACNGTQNQIYSSNGTRSKVNTTDVANVLSNYRVDLIVGATVDYYKDANTVVQKNTNVPSTGVPDRSNVYVNGIQTTTTVTAIQELYFLEIVGTHGETNLP